MKLEVLVADDHAIIRDGIKKILADTDDLVAAGEAANGVDVMERIRARDWDLLFLDISMPGRNGIELIKLVKAERPKLPILIFSMHHEEQYAVRAIRAGAAGYLSKEGDTELLLPAIRRVAKGGMFISPKVAELLASDMGSRTERLPHTLLTNREFEVLTRILRGTSLTAIAEELSLSVKTVSTHKSHILLKMGMSNDIDLARYAIEHNLLDSPGR
jgi:DNA-binding NarL/FixJ family response regulator